MGIAKCLLHLVDEERTEEKLKRRGESPLLKSKNARFLVPPTWKRRLGLGLARISLQVAFDRVFGERPEGKKEFR